MDGQRRFSEEATDLDEGSLVALAQDGDPAAFEGLVIEYQGKLFRLAYRMLNDRGAAEDAVQEVLTASWRGLPTLHNADAFGGWLYRMATNHCLDVLRRRARHPEPCVDTAQWECASGSGLSGAVDDPPAVAEAAAEMRALTALLLSLSAELRVCWLLYEIHGRSYAEIAAGLGISQGAVRGRLARARHQLAEGLEQWR
ncbi:MULTISPECIES: RNA polymerase sigma factor [Arthrobacter]|uniref:RNA polymerase sigma factor n=1 Tax=Arthrobacter TaxID=1663 RepID=UPI001C628EAA|nr:MULTISPECIES: RNA polymerase sigma factor [Arthrobacter]QYF89973.1 RNA polymerase sigma factor [Arthrobacter sp. PAMC25284]